MKKLLVIHPFLFAVFPILFLFAYNIAEVPASDLLLPSLVIVTGTVILLLSLRLILKNREKAAIVTSLFLALFFVYGHTRYLILSYWLEEKISVNLFLLPIWVLIFTLGAFFIIRTRRELSTTTTFLNIVASVLIIISIVNIAIFQIKTADLTRNSGELHNSEAVFENREPLPDIYYIILDAYARSDTLKEFWNYDNAEFIDYLSEKGFYVATQSRSNYHHTTLSLASSLNMKYLNLSSRGEDEEYEAVLNEMIANSRLSQFLKSKGYRFIFVRSTDFGKNIDEYAEVVEYTGTFGLKISSFARSLIQTTALEPVSLYFGMSYRKGILYVFDVLPEIATTEGPKFVFVHVNAPHEPFMFDRDGSPVTQSILLKRYPTSATIRNHQEYLDQLQFISKKTQVLLDELLSRSEAPPIIILQSDHGPAGYVTPPDSNLTEERLRQQRMKILNAYYFPGKDYDLLYQSITPVNSFRLVLNLYFDEDYELLKDESYYPYTGEPLDFIPLPPESKAD